MADTGSQDDKAKEGSLRSRLEALKNRLLGKARSVLRNVRSQDIRGSLRSLLGALKDRLTGKGMPAVSEDKTEGSMVSHLIELRDRLLRGVLSVLVFFILLVPFANPLYEYLASPLMDALPAGNSMISTEPHGPFFVPFKFAFACAVALAVPFLLYQIWAFVAPGLYRNEKRLVVPLLLSSSALFYLGILFSYYVVFPIIFSFFANTAPEGVAVMTDINAYLTFVIKLFFAFGVAFEVPVATVLMVYMGVTTVDNLKKKRPYIIVSAFVVGMLLTPPDVFSQTLLALPVWALFEVGLYCSRFFTKADADSEQDDGEDSDQEVDPKPQ